MLPAAAESLAAITPALARLCAAKNTVMLTPFVLETWAAVLSVFPAAIANLSILEIALNADPFPDLGKVVSRCQAKMQEQSKLPTQADPSRLSRRKLIEIANALQIPIE